MSRARPIAVALLLVFCAVFAQAVQLPQRVFACSCAGPPQLSDVPDAPDAAVFVGTVGQQAGDRVPITVETWFHGDGAADIVWIQPAEVPDGRGGVTIDTCGLTLAPGVTRFFVAHGIPPAVLDSNICLPGAVVDTPEGQALVIEATALFGAAQPPPTGPPETAAPLDLAPWLGGLGWVAALVGLALALFGAVAFLARRQRPG